MVVIKQAFLKSPQLLGAAVRPGVFQASIRSKIRGWSAQQRETADSKGMYSLLATGLTVNTTRQEQLDSHTTTPAPRLYRGIADSLSEVLPIEDTQRFLVYMHDITGLPWYASLIACAFLFRIAVLPVAMQRQKTVGCFSRFIPHLVALGQTYGQLVNQQEGHFHKKLSKRNIVNAVFSLYRQEAKKHDVAVRRLFYPQLIGIPFFFTFNLSVRHMLVKATKETSSTMDPALLAEPPLFGITTEQINQAAVLQRTEGPFFCPDLTSNDPTAIFPAIAIALTMISIYTSFHSMQEQSAQVRKQHQLQAPQKSKTAQTFMLVLQFLVIGTAPFSFYIPAYIYLYWSTSMFISTMQNLATKSETVQKWAGMQQPVFPRSPTNVSFLHEETPSAVVEHTTLSARIIKLQKVTKQLHLQSLLRDQTISLFLMDKYQDTKDETEKPVFSSTYDEFLHELAIYFVYNSNPENAKTRLPAHILSIYESSFNDQLYKDAVKHRNTVTTRAYTNKTA